MYVQEDLHVQGTYVHANCHLCRMLGAEEAVRQAVESREAQVKEKADSLEQAEARHK